jgi:hypothetical protein
MASENGASGRPHYALGIADICIAIFGHLYIDDVDDDLRILRPAALVCQAWLAAAVHLIWRRKQPLRKLYRIPPLRRAFYAAVARSLAVSASRPLPPLSAGAFPRLLEITVPFRQLGNSPPGRLAHLLGRCSAASNWGITSVAITARRDCSIFSCGERNVTLRDCAANPQFIEEALRTLGRHAGLTRLRIDWLDAASLEQVQQTEADAPANVPRTVDAPRLFRGLRHLETCMCACAAAPLVALLLAQRIPAQPNRAELHEQMQNQLSLAPPPPLPPSDIRLSPTATLTSLRVTLRDAVLASPRGHASCAPRLGAAMCAFGQLRRLRQLRVLYRAHLGSYHCTFTAAELAALRPLTELRELSIRYRSWCRLGPPYDRYRREYYAGAAGGAVTHEALLAFAAALPRLRHFNIMVSIASSDTYRESAADVIAFLPRLGVLCRRLEYLGLQMDLALEGLAASTDGTSATAPVFPELRCLDIGVRDGCPDWIAKRQRYVLSGPSPPPVTLYAR